MTRFFCLVVIAGLVRGQIAAQDTATAWPKHRLVAAQVTVLNLPDKRRFDASGLLLLSSGELLTLRNNRDTLLYRIEPLPGGKEASLVPLTDCFTTNQLARLAERGKAPWDCEGIAQDDQGRIYVCEESRRWILRCDPKAGRTERLSIDWADARDYFSTVESNASFEGVAIGGGKLYVANERNSPLIIEVDLASLRVTDHFVVHPAKPSFFGLHYSDLCWFEDTLWVLCRQHRVVLQVDAARHVVLAEFDYGDVEEKLGYRTGLSAGIMEGLAVSKDSLWLLTDNNGAPRGHTGDDIRPTLVRCARPDRK